MNRRHKSRKKRHGHPHRRVAHLQAMFARSTPPTPGRLFDYPPEQSAAEERVNAFTHGVAALATLLATPWLVWLAWHRSGWLMAAGCLLYAGSLAAVFTCSALSHWVEPPRLRHLFRTLDQAAIYLLTAGSFTPYFLKYLNAEGWYLMLPALWVLALLMSWDKLRGARVNSISIPSHVALGAFPFIAIPRMSAVMPTGVLALTAATVACYLVGLAFLIYDHHVRYYHAAWHVLVIIGCFFTFIGIPLYVLD